MITFNPDREQLRLMKQNTKHQTLCENPSSVFISTKMLIRLKLYNEEKYEKKIEVMQKKF